MSATRTRHQKRAALAFEAVKEQSKKGAGFKKEYRSFALSFPALLHTCGLAQAVAFAQAKKKHYAAVLADVQTVMAIEKLDLAAASRTAQFADYMRLTREALASASWVKRYAEALLSEEEGNVGNNDAPGA